MKLGQSGLGIVQVLIATAMLGALSLGVMQVSKNMSDVNRDSNSSLDVLMLKQEMISIVNDSKHCSASLIDGVPFKKSEIDDPEKEGRSIDLRYSTYDGKPGKERFSSKNLKFSKFGNIKIKNIKLVMDNVPTGVDYAPGNNTDVGTIVVEVEKPGNRGINFQIPVKVNFGTDATNNSTISSCASVSSSEEKLLVVHSQDELVPDCPSGWVSEKEGYSFILSTLSGGRVSAQDLSDPGSCLENFGPTIQIECVKNKCDYITGGDFSSWLHGAGVHPSIVPSRCRVCSKVNGKIKVIHSQTSSYPPCPPKMMSLWNGFSIMGVSIEENHSASFRLEGPGSCLKDFKYGLPHIECEKNDPCHLGTGGDFAMFLNAKWKQPDTGVSSPPQMNDISRCTVCIGVD
jgi:hypothetical protein